MASSDFFFFLINHEAESVDAFSVELRSFPFKY